MANKFSIIIDPELCAGCGSCVDLAPDIFKLDEQMKCRVLENAGIDFETLMKAARICATGAITVINNETGEKLTPSFP